MEIVTYAVAKYIKGKGYDRVCEYGYCVHDGQVDLVRTEKEWAMIKISNSEMTDYLFDTLQEDEGKDDCTAPIYLDVWDWLWNTKGIYIQVEKTRCVLSFECGDSCTFELNNSPEDTIMKVIEYLVKNDLIK